MRLLTTFLVFAAAATFSLSATAQLPPADNAGSCPSDHGRNRAKLAKFFAGWTSDRDSQLLDIDRLKVGSLRLLNPNSDEQICRRLNQVLGDYTSSDWILSYYVVDGFYIAVVSRHPSAAKRSGEFDPIIFFDGSLKPLVAFSS